MARPRKAHGMKGPVRVAGRTSPPRPALLSGGGTPLESRPVGLQRVILDQLGAIP
jgi:hypothetical protein